MKQIKHFHLPATEREIKELEVGELVYISGTLYTARDQAHKRIAAAIERGEPLPFELSSAAVYYCGPTPAPEGKPIGSCGPTTAGRMDAFTPLLIKNGLRVMVGKGKRSPAVVDAIRAHGAVYLSAIGGAAALYQSCVRSCEPVAYPDLGCEAVCRLTVEDFPAVVSVK